MNPALNFTRNLIDAICIGLVIGGVVELFRSDMVDHAITTALLLAIAVLQGFTIRRLERVIENTKESKH